MHPGPANEPAFAGNPRPSDDDRSLGARLRKDGAGIGVSVLLHGMALLLILLLARRAAAPQPHLEHVIPIAVVAESEGPSPQPHRQKSMGPLRATPEHLPREAIAHRTPSGVAPAKKTAPVDDLQMQLRALSKLRLPNSDTRLSGEAGTSDLAQNGDDKESGGEGAYSTRDIIRAQILRRWSLDMARLGGRDFVVVIHVVLKPDGTVLTADIVDKARYTNDATYRWIALSARNAVILSSPMTLPAEHADRDLDLTLRLDPRDTLQ